METQTPAPRTPMNLEVEYRRSYAREESRGFIKNISLTGAYIANQDPTVQPGDKIQVRLVVSGRERMIPAAVVWRNAFGCGVRFMPTNNRDAQIVDDLIYFAESKRSDSRDVITDILRRVS